MKYIIIVGIVILAVFLAVLSQIPLGIEPLTELYFENHAELPKHIFLNKSYNLSFTIHNLEYQDMNYEYIIEVFDENGTFMNEINKQSFSLANNESKSFQQDFTFIEHFDRAKINIKVIKKPGEEEPWFKKKLWWPDPNYPTEIEIHLWIEEIVGTTITITDD
jgi:hypothetical protein